MKTQTKSTTNNFKTTTFTNTNDNKKKPLFKVKAVKANRGIIMEQCCIR